MVRKIRRIGILACLCILFICYIVSVVSNLNTKSDQYLTWTPDSTLNYSDFQKRTPLFKEYDAQISSIFYWKELANGNYFAVVKIDRHASYFDKKAHSDTLLNHEKYHANIAAYAAKKFNNFIKGKPSLPTEVLQGMWDCMLDERNRLDSIYDAKTIHGTNIPMQDYWEYKIDSMYYADKDIDNDDEYSGIAAYFPAQPQIEIHTNSSLIRKIYSLERYNMRFRILTDYEAEADTSRIFENISNMLSENKFTNIKLRRIPAKGKLVIESECEDKATNRKFFDRYIFEYPFYYQITVNMPIETENATYYNRMKNTFLKSINIEDNNNKWIAVANRQNNIATKDIINKNDKDLKSLYVPGSSTYDIIYHRPIFLNGRVIIPFLPINNKSNEIDEVLVIINDKDSYSVKTYKDKSTISFNINPNSIKKLQFGYILKKDSLQKDYLFHSAIHIRK